MAASSWEDRAHDLRTAAEHCRDDAAELTHLAASTRWSGVAGDAFRATIHVQVRELHLVAGELDVAADLVAAHGRAVGAAESAVRVGLHLVERLVP